MFVELQHVLPGLNLGQGMLLQLSTIFHKHLDREKAQKMNCLNTVNCKVRDIQKSHSLMRLILRIWTTTNFNQYLYPHNSWWFSYGLLFFGGMFYFFIYFSFVLYSTLLHLPPLILLSRRMLGSNPGPMQLVHSNH